jgi:hypothetical protein
VASVIERPPEHDHRVPHFGSAYDKARKAYGLSAAVLLAWELIGIELSPTPVESFKVTLKSPQAAPYVLIALVLYFAFRTTIEWYQTEAPRRQMLASRIDFGVAHLIGASSLLLYAVQTLLRIQIADKVPQTTLTILATGFIIGVVIFRFGTAVGDDIREGKRPEVKSIIALLVAASPPIAAAIVTHNDFLGRVMIVSSVASGIVAGMLERSWLRRKTAKTPA